MAKFFKWEIRKLTDEEIEAKKAEEATEEGAEAKKSKTKKILAGVGIGAAAIGVAALAIAKKNRNADDESLALIEGDCEVYDLEEVEDDE